MVSRSFHYIPCFSSGMRSNTADGVKIRNGRSKDGSFHLCVGWILFPILLVPRGRMKPAVSDTSASHHGWH